VTPPIGVLGISGAARPGVRFWCLSEGPEEAIDEDLVDSQASPISLESDRRYWDASPENISRSSSRYVKRILNRNLQRQAALELILRDDLDSQDQDFVPDK
jgi:hypothetical protein